ncbi:MAG: adenosylhomocysteinase [Naasia sp.]
MSEEAAARITWTRSRMRMLASIRDDFSRTRPFEDITIGMSLHVEPKTVVLLETLAAGGATIVGTGNHGSTQDDMVAFLNDSGMTIHGARDDTEAQHAGHIERILDAGPQILLDNGGDLAARAAERGQAGAITGGTEETTSGGFRLRESYAGRIPFPVIVINDSPLKAIAENRHAVGQSAVESFQRITNLQVVGRRVVVIGYGWCGRGVAQYLRALGARVGIVELDEMKAFEAAYDGYRVGPLETLLPWADAVITATGRPGVLTGGSFDLLRDGAVLANIGHFPFEIDVPALAEAASAVTPVSTGIDDYELSAGRTVSLLTEGRMFNLGGASPKGNSIESMDLGFALQSLSLERVATDRSALVAGPQRVPEDIERLLARRSVELLGSAD